MSLLKAYWCNFDHCKDFNI